MPRPKGKGETWQNKRSNDINLKTAWAGGNYHRKNEGLSDSESDSGSEGHTATNINMRYISMLIQTP
jgi:hypothetical protein